MREVPRADHTLDGDPGRRLLGIEQHAVLRAHPPRPVVVDQRTYPLQLERGLGKLQGAAMDEVTFDLLALDDAPDLIDGVRDRPAQRHDRLAAAALAHRSGEPASSPRTHPPLRPEAPKPAISASSTTTSSDRIGSLQFVRGPQPGESGADDAHVGIPRALERGPRGAERRQLREPVRQPFVAAGATAARASGSQARRLTGSPVAASCSISSAASSAPERWRSRSPAARRELAMARP